VKLLALLLVLHHGTSVSRVGVERARSSAVSLRAPGAPQLELGLGYSVAVFDRWLRGATASATDGMSALVQLVSLRAGLQLPSATRFELLFPFGWVAPASRPDVLGLGDLELAVEQELGWRALSFRARAAVVAPTGQYRRADLYTVTDLEVGREGALLPVIHNTRASLGADVWAASAGGELTLSPWRRVAVRAAAAVVKPLCSTRDGIHWGLDVTSRIAADVWLMPDTMSVTTGLEGRAHTSDRIPQMDLRRPGESMHETAGGRNELLLLLGVTGRFDARWSCSVLAEIPIWQDAAGAALVETVAVSADCAVALGR
jgi:hypothetical protein